MPDKSTSPYANPPTADNFSSAPAYLFPGQGSQVPNMRERVLRHCPELLAAAEGMFGEQLFPGAHRSTRLLQPAVYCASIAGWLRAQELRPADEPVAFVGHSLGELAALAAAGSLSFEDGLRLVAERGALMEEAAHAGAEGGMLAVLGADSTLVAALVDQLNLTLATDNAPGELVLAGNMTALLQASGHVTRAGARAVMLPINGAFHSPAMQAITEPFERAVRSVDPATSAVPVYSGMTGRPLTDVAGGLAASLAGPVRWRQTLLGLQASGVHNFVDVGPGHVLAGLVRRTLPTATAIAVDDQDGAWPEERACTPLEKVAAS